MVFPFLQRESRRRVPPQRLRFPLPNSVHGPGPEFPRVALLTEGFLTDAATRAFTPEDTSGVCEYRPEAIVAPLSVLLSLANRKSTDRFDLSSVNTALIALTGAGEEPLYPADRDQLWDAFGVPVFEQFRDDSGIVIARECEVHEGLHLEDSTAPDRLPGLAGRIITGCCECGSETPRLVRLPARVGPRREREFVRWAATG